MWCPYHDLNGQLLNVWERSPKRSHYISDLAELEKWRGKSDIYFGLGLVSRDLGASRRGRAEDVVAIPGVWADIDTVEGGSEKPYPPSKEAAVSLATELLNPTVVVDSGTGIHVYWVFDEPWELAMAEEHSQATNILRGWQARLRELSRVHGWTLDATHDLSRVLRLPGTLNGDREVSVLAEDGPTYPLESIAPIALQAAQSAAHCTNVSIDLTTEIDNGKLEALLEFDEKFRQTWYRERQFPSQSEYDLSVATLAHRAGWEPSEIAALIVKHRRKQDQEDPKTRDVRYLQRTISLGMRNVAGEQARGMREQATVALETADEDVSGRHALELFSTLLGLSGGDRFVELQQFGDAAGAVTYDLRCASGRIIEMGGWPDLRSPHRFEARIGPALGVTIPRIKDERWRQAIQTILRSVQITEIGPERSQRWIMDYLRQATTPPTVEARNAMIAEQTPFCWETHVWVRLDGLARHIRVTAGERLNDGELVRWLRGCGFDRRTFGHHGTSSSWWGAHERMLKETEV